MDNTQKDIIKWDFYSANLILVLYSQLKGKISLKNVKRVSHGLFPYNWLQIWYWNLFLKHVMNCGEKQNNNSLWYIFWKSKIALVYIFSCQEIKSHDFISVLKIPSFFRLQVGKIEFRLSQEKRKRWMLAHVIADPMEWNWPLSWMTMGALLSLQNSPSQGWI